MPVPHEVTREFFIPTEEDSYMGNEAQTAAQQIEQRINDLFFILNLIDATRGMGTPEDENNNPNDNPDDTAEDVPNDNSEENEEREADVVEHEEAENNNDEEENENPPAEVPRNQEDAGDGNTRVIRLDEFDLLALPLLLMRSRIRNPNQQQRDRAQTEESEPPQDMPVDPLLMMLSRAFGPRP